MERIQLSRPIVFLDLETTGTNIKKDRIVEISVIKYNPDETEVEKTVRVNPTIPIPKLASIVHGITDDDIANEPPFRSYAIAFLDFLDGCDIGGYNVLRFDIPLLQEEFGRCDLEWNLTGMSLIDPMVIFQKKEPRNLSAAYHKYCGLPLDGAHQAGTDARAAKDILLGQIQYYGDLGNTIEDIHGFCNQRDANWIDGAGNLIGTDDGPAFGFGKYNGHLVSKIAQIDMGYLDWILVQDFDPVVKDSIAEIKEDLSS